MEPSEVQRAIEAARSTASALGLRAGDGVVVHNSNRIAVRLTPCDVLARVAPLAHQAGAEFEVEVGRRLAEAGCPVEEPEPRVEPRVYVRDGFAITLWTYYEAVPPQDIAPAEYAQTLERHHAGSRQIDLTAPHFTDRVAEAQWLVGDRAQTEASWQHAVGSEARDRRSGSTRAAAARRAASGQLAEHEERAAVYRP